MERIDPLIGQYKQAGPLSRCGIIQAAPSYCDCQFCTGPALVLLSYHQDIGSTCMKGRPWADMRSCSHLSRFRYSRRAASAASSNANANGVASNTSVSAFSSCTYAWKPCQHHKLKGVKHLECCAAMPHLVRHHATRLKTTQRAWFCGTGMGPQSCRHGGAPSYAPACVVLPDCQHPVSSQEAAGHGFRSHTWQTSRTRLMLLASLSYSATSPRRRASRLVPHSRGSTTAELGPEAIAFTTSASQASLASAPQSLHAANYT